MMLFTGIDNAAKTIAPIFKEMEWIWQNNKKPPNEDMIKKQLEILFNHVVTDNIRSTSTGRLIVFRIIDTGEIILGLEPRSYKEWCDSHE